MRLYVVHFIDGESASQGFSWFASKRAAEKRAREFLRDNGHHEFATAEVTAVNFKPTRPGILKLLRIHAGHPDNG